jgi:transcriptional regulator with XRE-family HTH domain
MHDGRYQKFVAELVEYRKKHGVSQQVLAKRVNLLQSDISKIERLERRIDVLEAILWLQAVGERSPAKAIAKIVNKIRGYAS